MVTYADSFTGSGPLGNIEQGGLAWEVISGSWERLNGRAYSSTSYASNPIAVINTGLSDADITLGVTYQGGDAIYFRVVDANNWWRLRVVRNSTTSTNYVTEYQWKQEYFSDVCGTMYYTGWGSYSNAPSFPLTVECQGASNPSEDYTRSGNPFKTGSTRQVESGTSTTYYYYVKLDKCIAGAVTEVKSYTTNSSINTLRVVARADVLSVYLNSSQQTGATDATHNTATKHGVGKGGPTEHNGSAIDNFTLVTFQPAAPTALSPSNNGTASTATPTISATLASFGSVRVKAEWQIASDAAFTTSLQTFESAYVNSGAVTYKLTEAQKLAQQQWYIRARAVPENGDQPSDWSSTNLFTVAHTPGAVNLKPTGGDGIILAATNRFSWQFADTSETDSQTAYRIIIERNDNAQVLIDTGKVVSANQFHDAALDPGLLNVQLRWRMEVWDEEDKKSALTPYQVFTPSDAPIINIIEPAEATILQSSRPNVAWTFSATGGRTQTSYRIVFTKQGNPTPEYDSGVVGGAATTFRPPIPVIESGNFYVIDVYTTDSINITVSDSITLEATYEAPDPVLFSVDTATYEPSGYVWITWQAEYDPTFLRWKVYRRLVGETTWNVLGEISMQNVTEFKDWLVPSQDTYEYLVVQVVERFGDEVESYLADPTDVYVPAGGYWLIDPVDSGNNSKLHNVTTESYRHNRERAEFNVIGRGRHADIGENAGITGSLTAQLRDGQGSTARDKKRKIETLQAKAVPVYLRNPFGDVLHVSCGDVDVARVPGVGPAEFVDITVPYSEVF